MAGNDIWIASKYITNPGGNGGKSRIPTLRSRSADGSETLAATNEEKSALLASTLFPPPPASSSVPIDYQYPEPVEDRTEITQEQLVTAVNKLSLYKAPGPDGIANVVFQRCCQLLDYLLPLFNAAVRLHTQYDPWKESVTVILRKPGKPDYSLPKAYRLIALLNTTAKLLSSIVTDRTSYILETHNLLPTTHFGGRPGRTTEDSLHLLESTVHNAWRQGKVVSALFLDIEGAFPNAVTEHLIHNLRKKRLPREIVSYAQEMLKDRRTQLRFDNHTSEWFNITNGIGQGDPFSMLLYIVYDLDLVTIAKNKDELTLAFVDDTVLLAIAKSFQDTHKILGDMLEREGGAYKWSADHNSRFETSKFGLVDFTLSKSKPCPPMTIRGNVITPTPSHKFLGVVVDQELRWKEHAAYALAKGAGYAALLRRLSRPAHGIPTRLIRQLYRAIAIPKMLYAASIWIKLLFSGDSNTPLRGSQGVTRKMSQAQRTATLVITGAMKTSPTDSLEIHANLLPMPLLLQHLLHNAALRLASRPQSHPLHALVKCTSKRNVICHKTALHHLFHGLKISPEKIETISPHPVHPTSLTPFVTDITSSKEVAIVDFQNCTNCTMIFTDGSSHNGLVGAAAPLFIDHNHIITLRHHLGKATEHTVFEAEAVGLLLTAHLLTQRREVSFPATIYADNQAAIQSSSHPTAKLGHYLLIHFRKLMKCLQNKKNVAHEALLLNWIAGHTDILGNELADREAKLTASSPTNATPRHLLPKILRKPLPASISAAKQDHNAKLQNRWMSIWK